MSFIRLSRFGKIATFTTAAGGSLYIFRDELKPYIHRSNSSKQSEPIKTNNEIKDLPEKIPYLLVGGGTASHSAMRAIRGHDPKAKVLIVGSENRFPYMRPMLSKDLWLTEKDTRKNLRFGWVKDKDRSIFYECDEFYLPLDILFSRENGGVSMIKNSRITHLDTDKKVAHLGNGQQVIYEKCLLAPGGKPKTLPELERAPDEVKERVLYFRTADDFLKLEKISETAKSIVIIGGGFLGTELACALSIRASEEEALNNQKIYQIYPESGVLGKILPDHLSQYVSSKVGNEGAQLMSNVEVDEVSMSKDRMIDIRLSNGNSLKADIIVCAIGLEPDIELAKSSGLEVDEKTGGYVVNSELEARTDVWVAGDASCFYDRKLGRRRVEHHDHAINSGKLAGENMTGAGKAYTHQSMFWSEVGRDISFEAVGIIDSSLPTVSVFVDPEELAAIEIENAKGIENELVGDETTRSALVKPSQVPEPDNPRTQEKSLDKNGEKYMKGVVFYLKDGVIVGILLWNLFSRLTIARRILNEQKKYEDFNEVSKLFNIYLDDFKTL